MTWLLVTRYPLGPALALLRPLPRHPYSAVPFPSNWQLWRKFPDALQQSSEVRISNHPSLSAENLMEPPPQLPVGDVGNMTVSWRRRLARVSSAAGGGFRW